jgi:hypothetical protein
MSGKQGAWPKSEGDKCRSRDRLLSMNRSTNEVAVRRDGLSMRL